MEAESWVNPLLLSRNLPVHDALSSEKFSDGFEPLNSSEDFWLAMFHLSQPLPSKTQALEEGVTVTVKYINQQLKKNALKTCP